MKIDLKDKNVFLFIILLFLVILFAIISIYNYATREKDNSQEYSEERTVAIGNYVIQDTNDGSIIQNKEAKFSLLAPKGWVVERYEGKITLLSSPLTSEQYENIEEIDVCMFNIKITKHNKIEGEGKTGVMDLLDLIDSIEKGQRKDSYYNVIFVDNNIAIETRSIEEDKKYVFVEVPFEDRIYSFFSGMTSLDVCIDNFDKILEQVKINR